MGELMRAVIYTPRVVHRNYTEAEKTIEHYDDIVALLEKHQNDDAPEGMRIVVTSGGVTTHYLLAHNGWRTVQKSYK